MVNRYNKHLFITGGILLKDNSLTKDVLVFNLQKRKYKTVKHNIELTVARDQHGSLIILGKIFVVGGYGVRGRVSGIDILDTN